MSAALAAQVRAALVAQTNLQVFDGAPDDGRPSAGFGAPSPEVHLDADGRAHMYAAVYVGVGAPSLEDERAAGVGGTKVNAFQVTAAGGDPNRAMRAAEKVVAALVGLRVPGGGLIRLDAPAGPPLLDREPTPGRYFMPLPFRVSAP